MIPRRSARFPHFLPSSILCLGAALLGACSGPSSKEPHQLTVGYNDLDNNQYRQAETVASGYIANSPNGKYVDEAYYLRGQARLAQGNQPLASEDLAQAIAHSKDDDLKAKAYHKLGDIAFGAERWEQAIDYYQNALKFFPLNFPEPTVLYHIGASMQALGEWDDAKPFFERARHLTTDDALRQRATNRADATFFALEFSRFSTQANAQAEADRLQAMSVHAEVVPEVGESALLYTVRAGAYPDFAAAQEARRQLLPRFPKVLIFP